MSTEQISTPPVAYPFSHDDMLEPACEFAKLRKERPISMLPTGDQVWLVAGYEDGREILFDPRLGRGFTAPDSVDGGFGGFLSELAVFAGPQAHARFRRLAGKALLIYADEMKHKVQEIADDLVDEMATGGREATARRVHRRGAPNAAGGLVNEPAQRMRSLLYGQILSRAVQTLAVLGIPDLLGEDVCPLKTLAERVRVPPESLRRLLRALVTFEVPVEPDPDVFGLGELKHPLRAALPGSALPTALLAADWVLLLPGVETRAARRLWWTGARRSPQQTSGSGHPGWRSAVNCVSVTSSVNYLVAAIVTCCGTSCTTGMTSGLLRSCVPATGR
jgi:hypothetical protein